MPIENSLEGSVNATLDALAVETEDVAIVGEHVHPIHTLPDRARARWSSSAIETVVSHPQANGAVRALPAHAAAAGARARGQLDRRGGAHGRRARRRRAPRSAAALAAELYGCEVLCAGVEDAAGNETRFVWLARRDAGAGAPAATARGRRVVFWGVGAEAPGWLVALPVGVRLPRRQPDADRVAPAQAGPRAATCSSSTSRDATPRARWRRRSRRCAAQVEQLRVLGSFPAA